jgi:ADP-ribosyl-[dinitrogen reductase] hydrolase
MRDAGGWDLAAIARNFSVWMRNRPVDIGATCARGIREFMHKGTLEVPYNAWDAGNGSVMRMVPVALASLGDDALLRRWALQQARLTHNHPLSDAACVAVGRMVQQAMVGAPRSAIAETANDLVGRHATFRFAPYPGLSSAYVVDTLQTVLHFFFNTETFEDCLVGVVNQGGDADTTGAIAGMIAGAFYGIPTFPKRWVRRLNRDVRDTVLDLATYLIRSAPMAKLKADPPTPG